MVPEVRGQCLKRLVVVERLLAELPANGSHYTILYYLLALFKSRLEDQRKNSWGEGYLYL